jgi:hypothetical protein
VYVCMYVRVHAYVCVGGAPQLSDIISGPAQQNSLIKLLLGVTDFRGGTFHRLVHFLCVKWKLISADLFIHVVIINLDFCGTVRMQLFQELTAATKISSQCLRISCYYDEVR